MPRSSFLAGHVNSRLICGSQALAERYLEAPGYYRPMITGNFLYNPGITIFGYFRGLLVKSTMVIIALNLQVGSGTRLEARLNFHDLHL